MISRYKPNTAKIYYQFFKVYLPNVRTIHIQSVLNLYEIHTSHTYIHTIVLTALYIGVFTVQLSFSDFLFLPSCMLKEKKIKVTSHL